MQIIFNIHSKLLSLSQHISRLKGRPTSRCNTQYRYEKINGKLILAYLAGLSPAKSVTLFVFEMYGFSSKTQKSYLNAPQNRNKFSIESFNDS